MIKRVLRALGLLLSLAWAVIVGLAIRYGRRWLGRPPRIWFGFMPIHFLKELAATARHAGYPARTVVATSRQVKYALVWDDLFDRVLDSEGIPWNERHWRALIDLVRNGDIWVANFDCLFFVCHDWRNTLTFRLIRRLGIRIIVASHGTDVIQLPPPPDRYGWLARMQQDYPNWDFSEQTPVSRRRVELFCGYADLVLPGAHYMVPLTNRCDALFHHCPIDIGALEPTSARATSTPLVVHAPNHRHVKGTLELLAAADRLRRRGFEFELRLVEGVDRKDALQIYAQADILADQFIIGASGIFALEGLALGKPVMTYLSAESLLDPVFNLPVVNTTLENMDSVLAVLIAVPQLRSRIGMASREAVALYQSIPALAEVWDQLFRHVWLDAPLNLRRTRHFGPERGARALTEDPTDPKFWPVEVKDLLMQIRHAVERATMN